MSLSSDERNELIYHRLQKSRQTKKEAELLFENSMLSASINRIYYSMFHALSALALADNFTTGKHGQLIGWFNRNYIKNGKIDTRYSKIIARAFNKRMDSDYEDFTDFTENEVNELISNANEFLSMIEGVIKNKTDF